MLSFRLNELILFNFLCYSMVADFILVLNPIFQEVS